MRQRKIPTIVGLLLVGAAVMIFRIAFDRVSPLLTRAAEGAAPKNVTVTNISDSTFTVSWITTSLTTGTVRLDGGLTTSLYYDDRWSTSDIAGPKPTYSTHTVTIRNLEPETTYTFRVLSGDKSYLNQGKPYEVRTAPKITGVGTNLEPAYGQIVAPSGNPVEGALVYLSLDGSQTLSALSKSSGTWVIPLHLARSDDLTAYIVTSVRIGETILIRDANGESSALADTLNDNPVPVMTIGKTYDFRKIQAEGNNTQNLANVPPAVLGTNTQTTQTVSITKPAQGTAITSNLPLIQGTGIAGNQVLIVIGIDKPVSDTVIIGADGIWRYTPPKPLSEGKQSVTITTNDAQNKTVALTHTFEILKSGTQVLGDATPSAALTPTLDTTPTPSSTLAGEPIPETGFPLPLIILLIFGFSLLSGGALILVK